MLRDSPKGDQPILTCAFQFSHLAGQIKKSIYWHWHLINEIPGCSPRFPPPRIGQKKGANLRTKLIKSNILPRDICSQEESARGHYKCGHCKTYAFAMQIKEFVHPQMDFRIALNGFSFCNCKQTAYIITCPCSLVYVGSSEFPIKMRTFQGLKIKLLMHLSLENHYTPDQMRFCVTYQ